MRDGQGGCFCKAVRYQISGVPSASVICHCTSCRKAHSASTVAWLGIEKSQLQIVSGVLRAFQSSAGVVRHFCELCGTPLAYETAFSPTMIDIASLSLDDPELYPPTAEIWLEDKLSWATSDPALEHFRKSHVGPQLE